MAKTVEFVMALEIYQDFLQLSGSTSVVRRCHDIGYDSNTVQGTVFEGNASVQCSEKVDGIDAAYDNDSEREILSVQDELTNSDGLNAGSFEFSKHISNSVDSNNRVRQLLGLCVPHSADADVIDFLLNSTLDMLDSVAAQADDCSVRKQFTSSLDSHVGLS